MEPNILKHHIYPSNEQLLVSISCITFNHYKFIRETIEGFLMQKTAFPFEILIYDDASKDGTSTIIKEYEERYPNLIRPIYQSENQYSKSIKISATYNWPRARGKYIAFCEGDDYWTDPYKLQKQVDFLEANPDCILCGTRVFVQRDGSASPYAIEPGVSPEALKEINGESFLLGQLYLKTPSRMYPKEIIEEFSKLTLNSLVANDFLITLFCIAKAGTKKGVICCLDEVMGCYREHSGGTWFTSRYKKKLEADLAVLVFALNNFNFGHLRIYPERNLLTLCKTLNADRCGVKSVDKLLRLHKSPYGRVINFAKSTAKKFYRHINV